MGPHPYTRGLGSQRRTDGASALVSAACLGQRECLFPLSSLLGIWPTCNVTSYLRWLAVEYTCAPSH
jgi:hypothetical protein